MNPSQFLRGVLEVNRGAQSGSNIWAEFLSFLQEDTRITQTSRILSRRLLCGEEIHPLAPRKHYIYLMQADTRA